MIVLALWTFGEGMIEVLEVKMWQERCRSWDTATHLDNVGLFQNGDVVIGGLINFHNLPTAQDLTFTSLPDLKPCVNFQGGPLRWAQAIVFAVEEINQDPFLLPGLRLGYQIMDSCSRHPFSLRGALAMISGGNRSCDKTGPVRIIIGEGSSTQSIILSRTLSPLHVPVISYQATCSCLSNRREYPNFFRTIPSDVYQARAMAHLAKLFGWTWVGAVGADNDYGRLAVQVFLEETQGSNICLAFFETLLRERLAQDVARAASTIEGSLARVILVFAWHGDVEQLLLELLRRNITDRQFLASEAWSTSTSLLSKPHLYTLTRGILGVAIRSAPIPRFKEHLTQVHPSRYPGNVLLKELWEETFGCSLALNTSGPPTNNLPLCNGSESLEGIQNTFTDTSNLRVTYNVYLAVYSAAHAFHSLLNCTAQTSSSSNKTSHCSTTQEINLAQLLEHLNKVQFTTKLGESFYFQEGGIPAVYDLVNWQDALDGTLRCVTVGRMEGSTLTISESAVVWTASANRVPVSVCSEECPPGTRKATKKGQAVCCFDCLPCAEGEISNSTGSTKCDTCPPEFWSNSFRTACVPRDIEFLSFTDTMGITLTTVAVSGVVTTVAVAVVFLYNRQTPIVKANNSELSFMLLLSIKFCFLCSLVFVGRPSLWSCRVQQAAFGITFVLCLSCILVKTIVVLAVFCSAKPGSTALMKWFGPRQQRGSVFLFTCIQVIICAIWLSLSPPSPHHNSGLQGSKVILECEVGSVVGFALVLGYIGLLAAICLLLAFFARKLPDNFNEAKFITFSMLIFCAVWIAFVPAYVSSPGKYSVAVEIFAILASSYGLLVCIFAPKCYIILVRPENNTKKFIMGERLRGQ
ncbi:olfactory receptor CR1 [Chanos chanos]|uniref:Olfactory receptor CR1 n=1 Tax=Chanos chanos TaxID=29144 RepID=A0A6J2ULD9_CHACN|nr:extracellular calcium-sensing receptor-like [Chanos chanos]